MSEVVIKTIGLKRYFDGGLVKALDGIDIQIGRGETVALVGPSGSGKTSLLSLIATFDFATEGSVEIFGKTVSPKDDLSVQRNKSIGFVFQLHNLLPHISLIENVMLPLHPLSLSKRAMYEKAEAMLDQVGLADRRDFLPVKVSGGERQRTAIARALINDPEIILGDEPTGNLDQENGSAVLELLLELVEKEQRTLLIATHNSEISSRFGRVLKLIDGKQVPI